MKLDGKTNEELMVLRDIIERDPANRGSGLLLYSPAAIRKIDKINLQITYNLKIAREAAGHPVNTDGYSGRKSNRR